MGAELTVESRPGAGSVFTMKMFLSEAAAPLSHVPGVGRIAGYAGPRRSILVTDDDPVHLDMVRDILDPLGFDLDFAGNGAACLASYRRRRPELVMLDIAMPGSDGWETARALRQDHGDAPLILMVSANAHDFQRNRREDDPHDDFLTKPYEIDTLLERIQTLLGLTWVHA
jgi:CheY-like chemotaxis protein